MRACFAVDRLFGFLFGCVASGSAVYTYLLGEYKASNDLLTEDIYVSRSHRILIAAYATLWSPNHVLLVIVYAKRLLSIIGLRTTVC